MQLSGRKLWVVRVGVLAAIVGAIVAIQLTIAPDRGGAPSADAPPTAAQSQDQRRGDLKGPLAPEVRGIAAWINSPPLTLQQLRGKVVLVDFWAYSCVNCIRTVPYLQDWHTKYSSRGLVLIGLHAPEFNFERDEANVRNAVAKQGIAWPVALDNDFATWRAYQNRYWPHKFLIDKDGAIRYDRIGEGGYADTENQIRKLLVEAGARVDDIPLGGVAAQKNSTVPITRELYAGYAWADGGYLGNAGQVQRDAPSQYVESGNRENGKLYLQGQWIVGKESVLHSQESPSFGDYVGIRFTAASVNAVMRLDTGRRSVVVATVDGAPVPESLRGDDLALDQQGRTYFIVDEPRLYNVVRAPSAVTRNLELRVTSPGVVLHTFTFGS